MHSETDETTRYATLARYTGHSVRYLRTRAMVRAVLVACATVLPFTYALTK